MKGNTHKIKYIVAGLFFVMALGVYIVFQSMNVHDMNKSRGIYVAASQGENNVPFEILEKNDDGTFFRLKLGAENAPIDLAFTLDKNTETFAVSGSGLDSFSDVTLETVSSLSVKGSSRTKADWAGLFVHDEALDFNPAFLKGENTYKVAVYGQIKNDAASQNPYLIEVYSAPGGGLRTNALVNDFTGLACGDYSWCDSGAIDGQNQALVDNYVKAFMLMTEQFSAVMMQQVSMIGQFMDAKMVMQTQTELSRLQAQAHKDYHPDEQMCRFGTFVRNIAHTEIKAGADKRALNVAFLGASANTFGGVTSEGASTDIQSRLVQFREVYCDPADNNGGLQFMCDWEQDGDPAGGEVGAEDLNRANRDIDYTRTVDGTLALDINFSNTDLTADEEDVIALARNLYWFKPFDRISSEAARDRFEHYFGARRAMAINNIAHNSFTEIVSHRASADLGEDSGPAFMKALMRELGIEEQEEIDALLGESMSYYGQMEVLTKKIYQSPQFYTNLYTKPTNLRRIGTSIDAISSIQERDHLDSSLREEMLLSMLVEQALMSRYSRVEGILKTETSSARYRTGN